MEELNKKYKERVVILIDEYEAPILEHLNNKKKQKK
nr:AAA family ATPase [Marinitoga lauensis]